MNKSDLFLYIISTKFIRENAFEVLLIFNQGEENMIMRTDIRKITVKSCFVFNFKWIVNQETFCNYSETTVTLYRPVSHTSKVVHNGGSPGFEGLLFIKSTTGVAQILHSLSCKECSIILPKLISFGLFILILVTSAIMDQTACFYDVTTS